MNAEKEILPDETYRRFMSIGHGLSEPGNLEEITDKELMGFGTTIEKKSVKSMNRCKSVIQMSYDIVKAHGGVPIAIGMKVKTKEGEGSEFIIQLRNN